MPMVSINLVTFNSKKFLENCLNSVFDQTFRDFQVMVVDNASMDGTVDYIKKNFPKVYILRNNQNQGFSGAHNQAIELSRHSKYILLTNPDIILVPDFLEKAVAKMESDASLGSLGGKLRKVRSVMDGDFVESEKTQVIDTTGLSMLRNGAFVERGTGETDLGQYDTDEEVFGVSGALCLYRTQALESIRWEGEYFDRDFFVYQEDVDVAWRLALGGWKSWYLPAAMAYHYRGAESPGTWSQWEIIKNRRRKSALVNYCSYRNHFYLLVKNLYWSNFFRYLPFIAFYEFRRFVYIVLFETRTLRAFADIAGNFPKMLRKRRGIMAGSKITAREVRAWIQK
ncbi:MAG: glycosyl transferase family protein [Parcubacteria group bacterium Gr01-1014_18]|nr:MAG: glycosyl transferase family protein [Parcubacteria group bacterium Greene0416_36]TSC81309.1 MAG: glycosyl transferase family protein [Parcubacteria group bacterium Gr01-1014_18]TSC99331.1 MAG: glycosyl transferase family protein [Parcubacteria group bacterium Greene1014_20]TSD06832.1 MAG: glycosyl transferase family protein [Parcubacteria group bacterium Greene0714_2]